MRKHILSSFSNHHNYHNKPTNYYDEVTQVSYEDSKFTKAIVSRYETSGITESIENSDPDEFGYMSSTKVTFTVENSDEDELYMIGRSMETRVVESSDPDEFIC
jgi:hypothetical protein